LRVRCGDRNLVSEFALQVDCTEARYLLAGAADGSVGVYDTQQPTFVDSALHVAKHEALFTVDKSVPQGHVFSVSSVQWYPVDTGLFVTGSYDKSVNLWDTNTRQVSERLMRLQKVAFIFL
jgi:DNA excision repair protein ERCC-8